VAKIRVLVVDDSATMRSLITAALNRDPEIEVCGAAGDPFEARGMIKALNPDVVTLDIEMPNMNGIEFLEKIMRLRPMPVVMVSTLTQAGAEMTLRALELGAIDCVAKPADALGTQDALNEIVVKVKIAARASVRTKADNAPATARKAGYMPSGDVVAIGSSTGGVEALLSILTMFPDTCPPTVITQHMPATFTASFAARLDRASGAKVQEAFDGALLEPGKVYVAPGGATHLEVVRSAGLRCRLVAADPVSGHRPSVDVLFNSVANAVGDKAVGAILTGMGRDGAQGLLAMRKAGAKTLGQDEQSCVVYGMPRSAFEIGAVEKQVSLSSMGQSILDLASARR
jgi:two-component system chemotaxis response regulator CheB